MLSTRIVLLCAILAILFCKTSGKDNDTPESKTNF